MMINVCKFCVFSLCLILVSLASVSAQEAGPVVDTAQVFAGNGGKRTVAQLEHELAMVMQETGAQLIFRTESTATGSTARKMAQKVVSEQLDVTKPGAVMVYIRADDSIGVAVTAGSDGIPAYVFSTVEKAAGERPANLELPEYALRSGRELIAVFRKYYSPEAGKEDPRKRGDKILMACVVGGVFLLVFGFVFAGRRAGRG